VPKISASYKTRMNNPKLVLLGIVMFIGAAVLAVAAVAGGALTLAR
jgi:hypothetical protein